MEPYTHRVDTSWMSGKGTTAVKLKKAGYLSATPVYGQVPNTNGRTKTKTPFLTKIVAYDASIMTNVEYVQAPAPKPAPAPAAVAAPIAAAAAPAAPVIPKEVPGTGANRGSVGSIGPSTGVGVTGSAQAGLVGSVNTEEQNDDTLLPYQKV
tara:strand:+ start:65 stop:520 length:456 start_codon:yes stop_codon:yes gene_type:complete